MSIGAVLAYRQHQFIASSQAVPATITKSYVQTQDHRSGGKRRTRYVPVINYTYVVSGQRYNGDRIYPGDMSSTGSGDAHDVVSKFPVAPEAGIEFGGTPNATAYYDRDQPSRAFLVRQHGFGPYAFILFPMIHMSIGVLVAVGLKNSKRPDPVMKAPGRWELPSGMPIGQKLSKAAGMTALWMGVGAAVAGHYFSVAEKPYETGALWMFGIYFAIGLIPLWVTVHYFRLKSRVGDATVTVDSWPIRRGQLTAVNVQIDLAGGGRVDSGTVKLICKETTRTTSGGKTQTNTRDCWSDEQPFTKPQDLMSDRTIKGEARFVPAIHEPASSEKGQRHYPKIEWEILVAIKRPGPDYRARFVVEVV
jgi:hypothetical protein